MNGVWDYGMIVDIIMFIHHCMEKPSSEPGYAYSLHTIIVEDTVQVVLA